MPPARHAYLRLLFFGALFVALTVAGIAWAVSTSGLELQHLRALRELPVTLQLTVAGLSLALLAADMLRFRLAGAAVGVKVSWLATWDATVASFFFSWITPGSALGDPATIYMLGRRGVPWGAATILSFGKSITGLVSLLLVTFVLLGLGWVPDLHPALFLPFLSGTAVLACMALTLVAGAVWPERLGTWFERCYASLARRRLLAGPRAQRIITGLASTTADSIQRLGEFRRGGFPGSLALMASHLVYYGTFTGVLVALAAGFGASPSDAIPMAVIYQCFTYVLPTPGGAGISEGTAVAFFGGLLSPQDAVVVVLLFRSLTFYLHILLGLVYLPLVGGGGAIRGILERRSEPG